MRKKKTPLQKAKDELWELCKQITRKRHGYTCYTCGAPCDHPHTGHFISSSVCSVELRYHLSNLRPQCYSCNINKSGNWIAFEDRLTVEFGPQYVADLKELNRLTKGLQYDILWYQAKIEEYKKLL